MRACKLIYGHPDALARPVDHEKIQVGNRTMQVTAAIMRACIQHGVACGL